MRELAKPQVLTEGEISMQNKKPDFITKSGFYFFNS